MAGRSVCESCGRIARVELRDGSRWCLACHVAAITLGYDDESGTRIGADVLLRGTA
jgi:hypothetical protein